MHVYMYLHICMYTYININIYLYTNRWSAIRSRPSHKNLLQLVRNSSICRTNSILLLARQEVVTAVVWHTHTHTHTHAHTQTHTHTHTLTHTHTHTHTQHTRNTHTQLIHTPMHTYTQEVVTGVAWGGRDLHPNYQSFPEAGVEGREIFLLFLARKMQITGGRGGHF